MLITITGPSGSGKSYISELLCSIDERIVHLNIDEVGHSVLERTEVKKLLLRNFDVGLLNGKVDRKELGNIVFNNQEKMKVLTDITWNEMEKCIDEFIRNNKGKIIILDWILIPKTKYFKEADINILVTSSFEERMRRAINRDNISEEKFREREQATLDFNMNSFDYVILNEKKENLESMVKMIYAKGIVSR